MKKGRSAVIGILLLGIVMGLATWPLLAIRRQKEIRRTQILLGMIEAECEKYRQSHGAYPADLAGIRGPGKPVDAWNRPIGYAVFTQKRHGIEKDFVSLWSTGPDPDSTSDDIHGGARAPGK